MKGLASFVMRGPSQAVMVTSTLALLSLMIPLLGMLSTASVGLVSLRQGARPALTVSLLAMLACGLFIWLVFGSPLPAGGFLILQWLPILLLGIFLRNTRSLNLTVQLALGFGVLVILGQYLLLNDPVAFWQDQLEPLVDQLEKAGLMESTSSAAILQQMAGWMTGILAAALSLQLILSLLLARWWQSLLYNPGGFQREFHAFRLHRLTGIAGLLALALLLLPFLPMTNFFGYLGLLLFAVLFLQGLAVIHAILARAGARTAWLVGLYLLLLLLPPQTVLVLAVVGLLDISIDFRARFERSRSTGGN
jgi:hypothetical protein